MALSKTPNHPTWNNERPIFSLVGLEAWLTSPGSCSTSKRNRSTSYTTPTTHYARATLSKYKEVGVPPRQNALS